MNYKRQLSKHSGYNQVWTMLQSLLFWRADNLSINDENGRFKWNICLTRGDREW